MSAARVLKRLGQSGATAAEFALLIPAFITLVFGVLQVGITFYNYTSLQNAIGEGAREATLFPRRTDTEIRNRITASAFNLDASKLGTPTIVHGTDGGQDYVDITVTYNGTLNFGVVVFKGLTLTQTRRAYLP